MTLLTHPWNTQRPRLQTNVTDKPLKIKQEFKLGDDEIVKLEIPKYNNESDEDLLLTLCELNDIVVTYDLFTLLNATKVYDRFQRCLSGDA